MPKKKSREARSRGARPRARGAGSRGARSRGAGSRAARAKKSTPNSYRFLPFGILIILLIGITVIIVLLASPETPYQSALRERCKGERITPGLINECLALGCSFDVAVCPASCPIGYQADKKGCVIGCECAVEGRFQGDIHFDEDSIEIIISMFSDLPSEAEFSIQADDSLPDDHITNNLWDRYTVNGRHKVPYDLADDIIPETVEVMKKLAESISERSCIDFALRESEKYYVHVTSGEGCWADVGMFTKGHPNGKKYQLNLAKYCVLGVALHEAMHILGYPHEHNRFDRDGYVEIRLENVAKDMQSNFEKCTENMDISRITKYSDSSLMHYTGYSFTINEDPTIVLRASGKVPSTYALDFTPDDMYKLLVAYKCPIKRSSEGGTWTGWTPWSECIGSSKDRWKICENSKNKPSSDCYIPDGPIKESKTEGCPNIAVSKGHWSQWESWTACSKTCDGGSATRKRTCTIPGDCGDGKTNERKKCGENPCPVKPKPKWSAWSRWSQCSRKCGGGKQTRKRQCRSPDNKPANTCSGDRGDNEINTCNTKQCEKKPVPPGDGWDKWTHWSACSLSCGRGRKTRERKCKLKHCSGKSKKIYSCNTKECEPEWGTWGSWSECTEQCGGGEMTRKRQCFKEGNKPATTCSPSNGGSQIKTCNTIACTTLPPTTLLTTKTTTATTTLQTTKPTTATTTLQTTKPTTATTTLQTSKPTTATTTLQTTKPTTATTTLQTTKTTTATTTLQTAMTTTTALQTPMTAPTSGSVWDNWEPWTSCSKTCGGGEKSRKRNCKTGSCGGASTEKQECNKNACSVPARWGEWQKWSECTKRCDGGEQTRKRQCLDSLKQSVNSCSPEDGGSQSQPCNTNECVKKPIPPDTGWDNWLLWSSCSKTCDGKRARKRNCKIVECTGNKEEVEKCNADVCADQDGFHVFDLNPVAVAEYLCGSEPDTEWYFGDFNGDTRTDLLCSSKNKFFKLSHADETGALNFVMWKGHISGCTGSLKYVADFNGDGREDLLCKDITARKLTVKITTEKGLFSDQTVYAGFFCTLEAETLFVLDCDGDGKADIVCQYLDSSIEIKLNKY